MIEVLRLDFVRTARAKGLPESAVLFRHALKVAILPIIGYSGPAIAGVLIGFHRGGDDFRDSRHRAVFRQQRAEPRSVHDLRVVLIFGLFLILCNLAADILYFAGGPPREPAMRTLRSFVQVVSRDPLLIACAIFLVVVLFLAVCGGWLTGYDANQISAASLQEPSRAHWFGTDLFGRDLLTRTLYGARISLLIAAAATAISLTVGVTYGMISGYVGGRVDNLMMRVLEIIYALPTLILVIVLVATLEEPARGPAGGDGAARGADAHRAAVRFRRADGMADDGAHHPRAGAGHAPAGLRAGRVCAGPFASPYSLAHLLPNLSGIILVYLTLTIPAAMLDESFLSFLGLGVQAPKASWARSFPRRAAREPDPFVLVDAAFSRRAHGADAAGAQLSRRWVTRCARPAFTKVRK